MKWRKKSTNQTQCSFAEIKLKYPKNKSLYRSNGLHQ